MKGGAQIRKDAYHVLEPVRYGDQLRMKDLREFVRKLDGVSDVALLDVGHIAVFETEAVL